MKESQALADLWRSAFNACAVCTHLEKARQINLPRTTRLLLGQALYAWYSLYRTRSSKRLPMQMPELTPWSNLQGSWCDRTCPTILRWWVWCHERWAGSSGVLLMDGLDHAWNKTNRQGATEDSAYKTHLSRFQNTTGCRDYPLNREAVFQRKKRPWMYLRSLQLARQWVKKIERLRSRPTWSAESEARINFAKHV